jgi:hypothetical protein
VFNLGRKHHEKNSTRSSSSEVTVSLGGC